MLFDVQAALAEILSEATPRANPAKPANPPPPISGISDPSPAETAPAAVLPFAPKPKATDESDAFRHGRSVTGSPLTWTGRIVSLTEWRRLSEWERDGSTGKLWNGITRQWEPANADGKD